MGIGRTCLRIGCVLALLALPLVAAVDDAVAENLLMNGDFETGDVTSWEVFGVSPSSNVTIESPDNGPTAPGTYNAFLDNQAQALALLLKQSTPAGSAVPGELLYSVDLKLDQADVGGVLFVHIFAEQAGGGVVSDNLLGPYFPWNEWQTFSGSLMAPANADFFTIQIEAVTGATTGSNCRAHADNVILDQGTVDNQDITMGGVKALYR